MLLNVSTIHTQYSNPWNWVSPSYFRKDLNKISLIKLQNIGIEFVYSIVEIDSKWVSPLNTSAVDVIRCPDVCAHKYFLNELLSEYLTNVIWWRSLKYNSTQTRHFNKWYGSFNDTKLLNLSEMKTSLFYLT